MQQDDSLVKPEVRYPGHGDTTHEVASNFRLPGRLAYALPGILLFIVALQVMKAGASSLASLFTNLDLSGPANAFGFGWLMAYATLSGSPVASLALSLQATEVLSPAESLAAIAGSRVGASFIVLLVGFVSYVRGRGRPDGLAIGVLSLLATATTQIPAWALGSLFLRLGWFDQVRLTTPSALIDVIDSSTAPIVDALDSLLPGAGLLAAGIVLLVLSLSVFDRAIPPIDTRTRSRRSNNFMRSRWGMFALGGAVTAATMSVAVSVTLLVPLAMKGYLRRESVLPYVMGANITTFIDTLFAAMLLGGAQVAAVVLIEMVAVAVVSIAVLGLAFGLYSRVILGVAHEVTGSRRHFATFLLAIVAVPVVLLLL